jgi:hypothetical protein
MCVELLRKLMGHSMLIAALVGLGLGTTSYAQDNTATAEADADSLGEETLSEDQAKAVQGYINQLNQIKDFTKSKCVVGPATVNLGSIASIQVPAGYDFLQAQDAQQLLTMYGNMLDPQILGLIQPSDQSNS